ncbi:paraquat-inducible protein A [Oleiagrimonas soli]|uniref:Paraquat-inducible protein A n=1 Tax=Oleiagrimonas soli TaxID=1543381 RepID=A0A099CVG1_9GAMM|nr:paraquat-inducible protein A [Oleiagrimonas soli]KGI77774.1 paraquat-inducible protein A [Oleiagrimonas soli]MBB6183902.1 paraquat-inducible protein A [Oleiagrimonas soli]
MEPSAHSLVICEHCDAVHRKHELARGEVARCVRCQAVLYRRPWLSLDSMFALALAAAITFFIANVWPIVTLELNGHASSATLWQAIVATWNDGVGVVSVLAALMLFFFPMLQVLLFGWVLGFLRAGRLPPGFIPIMRVLHAIRPWSMVEVFMLGTLVAVVKVGDIFEVILQPGIWAFAALTVLLALVASFDVRRIWLLKRECCG